MVTKRVFEKAVKKAAKKAKKAVKKPSGKKVVKKVLAKKTAVKKPVKKPAKKVAAKKQAPPKTVSVKAVTDSTGVVTMKSVDDPGDATVGQTATVKAVLDKETGVVTMVPDTEE